MPTTYDLLVIADSFLAGSWELTEEEFATRLESFVGESADKLAALRAVHTQLTARAATCKAEAERLTAGRKSAERQDARVTALAYALLAKMRELGEKPAVEGVARIQANGGKAPLVGLDTLTEDQIRDLPFDLVRIERRPDADAIRKVLESGGTVPGVRIGERGEGVRFA